MVPLSVFARYNYHKASDGSAVAGVPDEEDGRSQGNDKNQVTRRNGEGVYNTNVVTIEPKDKISTDYEHNDRTHYDDNPAFDKF